MKRNLAILVLLLSVSASAYSVYLHVATAEIRSGQTVDLHRMGLAWLEREFSLPPDAMEGIAAVHQEFIPECRDHCRALSEARERLAALSRVEGASAGSLATVGEEIARIEQECFRTSLANIERVRELMPAEEGRRYQLLMRQRLLEARLQGAGQRGANTTLESHVAHDLP